MNFSITANIQYTVEHRTLLRNSHCLSAGSDSLYLQFKPTIWTQSYPRKHNFATRLQERHILTTLRHTEKTAFVPKLSNVPLQSSLLPPLKFNVGKPT